MLPLQSLGLPEIIVILFVVVVPLAILAALVVAGVYLYRRRSDESPREADTETTDRDDPMDQ